MSAFKTKKERDMRSFLMLEYASSSGYLVTDHNLA